MITKQDKNQVRKKRHGRVRSKISGTAQRPRLNVFRSNKNIYAQLIDDVAGVTLVSANTQEKEFKDLASNIEAATKIGETIKRARKISRLPIINVSNIKEEGTPNPLKTNSNKNK